MKINVGTTIDLTELLQGRLLIQANSGGGKSVLSRSIIEQSHGHVPAIITDIEGEYYTLKEKFGDFIIIGGQHADIPINLKTAKLLPKEIIGNRLSVILDLSDLQMSDRILYVKHFIETMMDLGREYWVPYFVFLEEAHKLCGEQDKQASATAVKDLMSRGRKRGYCGVLITQRISKLHKDAAAECNNKFIGRTLLDIDRERAAKELGLTSNQDKLAIRDLSPGSFYAFGTAITPHHVHQVKVNMPKTKIPKAGVDFAIKPQPLTPKIKAVLERLSAPVEEPKKTSPSIRSTSHNSGPPAVTYEAEYKQALSDNKALKIAMQDRDKAIFELKKTTEAVIKILTKAVNIEAPITPTFQKTPVVKTPAHKPQVPGNTVTGPPAFPSLTDLGKCSRAIIMFLVSFPDRVFSKVQIGCPICYSPNSGNFNNSLGELTQRDLIVREGSRIKASMAALEIVGPGFTPPQRYNAHDYLEKLAKCEREIYQVLLDEPEEAFTKDELAAKTPSTYSANSGNFNNSIGALGKIGLLVRESGKIQLNPELREFVEDF